MSTPLRIIDAETIKQLATPDELINWMRNVMQVVSRRNVELPLRRAITLPDDLGMIGMMPGYVGEDIASAGVKLVSLVPPGKRKGSSHLGLMALYDADGVVPQAILCGATITALRTAAATAVATDALSCEKSKTLTILGAGEQADAHINALMQVRAFDDIRIWSRRREQGTALAKRARERHPCNITAAPTIAEALSDTDVICAVTAAKDPILLGANVAPGTHVNLVGSSMPDAREADDALVSKSAYFVDYIPSTMDQAGELLHAIKAGVVTQDHIKAEIGEVLAGSKPGRRNADQITLYKSLGVAAQDIAAAHFVYLKAKAQGLGVTASI